MTPIYLSTQTDYQYARIAPPKTFSNYLQTPFQASQAVVKGLNQKQVSEYELAPIKEPLSTGGGSILASLATQGGFTPIKGIGQLAGLAVWMGSHILGSKVTNGLVQLKTGLDLGQDYINSSGERQKIFANPEAIPLHLLPEVTINQIGDRLNIPYGNNRTRQIEDKIKQISIIITY